MDYDLYTLLVAECDIQWWTWLLLGMTIGISIVVIFLRLKKYLTKNNYTAFNDFLSYLPFASKFETPHLHTIDDTTIMHSHLGGKHAHSHKQQKASISEK